MVPRSGTAKRPASVTRYGTGDDPKITACDSALGVAGDWTDLGSNVWSRTWADTCRVVIVDGAMGVRCSTQAAVNAASEWFWDAGVLYLYSTSNPATAFTTLEAGKRTYAIYARGRSHVKVHDVEIYGGQTPNAADATDDGGGIVIDDGCSDVEVADCEVWGCYGFGIVMRGVTGATVHGVAVHDIDGDLTNSTHGDGIAFKAAADGTQSTAIKVYAITDGSGCVRSVVHGTAIDDFHVYDCNFQDCYNYAIYVLPDDGETSNDVEIGPGIVVDHIGINACIAVHLKTTGTLSNVWIHGNTIDMNSVVDRNHHGINLGTNAGTNIVEKNKITNAHNGIRIFSGTSTIRYNSISGYTLSNIGLFLTGQVITAYGNLVDHADRSVAVGELCSCTIYNNTFTRWVNYCLYMDATGSEAGQYTIFKNNICWTAQATSNGVIQQNNPNRILTSDYNRIYTPDVTSVYYRKPVFYNTLAAWAAGTGQDAHSTAGVPEFVDTATQDYRLAAASPCIGAGLDLGSPYNDILSYHATWPDHVRLYDQDGADGQWMIGCYGPYTAAGPAVWDELDIFLPGPDEMDVFIPGAVEMDVAV